MMIYLGKWLKSLCSLQFRKYSKFKALFCMWGAWYESHSIGVTQTRPLERFSIGLFTWNAEGIPRFKTGLVSNFIFFVGSHKCAYPTDIEFKLRSGESTFIYTLQYIRTSLPQLETIYFPCVSRSCARVRPLGHRDTVLLQRGKQLFIVESFRRP